MGKNKAKTGRQTESNLYDSTEVTYHVVPLDIIRQHGGGQSPPGRHPHLCDWWDYNGSSWQWNRGRLNHNRRFRSIQCQFVNSLVFNELCCLSWFSIDMGQRMADW